MVTKQAAEEKKVEATALAKTPPALDRGNAAKNLNAWGLALMKG